jgi:hypothetical protein
MSALTQINSLRISQNTGQYLRIEQSNLMAMSSSELDSLIREIESSELFIRLFRKDRIIRYKRFEKSDINIGCFMLDESKTVDNKSPEIDSLLIQNREIVEIIRTIGHEKFKKYFLFPEEYLSENEVAESCGITLAKVRDINNLVSDMAVLDEFYTTSSFNSEDVNYTKIASIEKNKNDFIICYYSNLTAKGKYIIDYEKFENSVITNGMNKKEINDTRSLFKKLEMVNTCKETLYSIINNIIRKQSAFIESGDLKELLPLSQKEMALQMGISPGTLSRAIKFRTIEIPCGREVAIKSLFPNPRRFKSLVLKKILESEKGMPSDAVIQTRLAEKYGINISRRSVADIRKELKIPAGGAR